MYIFKLLTLVRNRRYYWAVPLLNTVSSTFTTLKKPKQRINILDVCIITHGDPQIRSHITARANWRAVQSQSLSLMGLAVLEEASHSAGKKTVYPVNVSL